jgi:hypothetical protein
MESRKKRTIPPPTIVRVSPIPRTALLRVLSMAEDMSHSIDYGEHDGDRYLGVHPAVAEDLAKVRRWLGARSSS